MPLFESVLEASAPAQFEEERHFIVSEVADQKAVSAVFGDIGRGEGITERGKARVEDEDAVVRIDGVPDIRGVRPIEAPKFSIIPRVSVQGRRELGRCKSVSSDAAPVSLNPRMRKSESVRVAQVATLP